MAKTLGIFHGKKDEYNRLILKGLVTGEKTTMQIAEYIYQNSKQPPSHNPINEKRKIYSVIARKGSRLNELEEKGYIFRGNALKWNLTTKGLCLAITFFETSEIIKYVNFDRFGIDIQKVVESLKDNPLLAVALKTKEGKKKLKEVSDKLQSDTLVFEMFLNRIKDLINDIIKKGINIDSMTDNDIMFYVAGKLSDFMKDIKFLS